MARKYSGHYGTDLTVARLYKETDWWEDCFARLRHMCQRQKIFLSERRKGNKFEGKVVLKFSELTQLEDFP